MWHKNTIEFSQRKASAVLYMEGRVGPPMFDCRSMGILPMSITGVSPVETDELKGQDGPETYGQDARATMRHCGQCDCAGRVWNAGLGQGLPGGAELWVCANHPDRAGLLTVVACGDCHLEDVGPRCRSFRVRRDAGGTGEAAADDNVRHIGLTGGLFAIVDAADFETLSRYNWRATGGDSSYACCEIGGKKVYMHRLIMNPPAGMVVDHINGNRWDNRRGNLRVCTQAENLRNSRKSRGTSRFKGVFWDARRRKWRVTIRCGGKTVHLGRYDDEVEAAKAYDRAAVRLFGQYARLNFPEPKNIVWLSGRIYAHGHVRGHIQILKSEIRNPNFEIRNKLELPKLKIQNGAKASVNVSVIETFGFWSLFRISHFGLRAFVKASDFPSDGLMQRRQGREAVSGVFCG